MKTLPNLLLLFRRQVAELLVVLPDAPAFFVRQPLEFLPATANLLTSLVRHFTPA